MIESNETGVVIIRLEEKTGKLTKEIKLNTIAYRPTVASFKDLSEGSYSYSVETIDQETLASEDFKINSEKDKLKVLVVSCNALHELKKGDVDLWASMLKYHDTPDGLDVDMLIHIGDQIYEYTRDVWKRCYQYFEALQDGSGKVKVETLQKIDKSLGYGGEWSGGVEEYTVTELMDLCVELFRSLYRHSWNHPPMKKILSRVSNHMILDDHDIRNGWGILDNDRKNGTIEHTLGECAHKAYREYQVQLWRDVDHTYRIDHRMLFRGDTVIFLMDVRNPRTFCYNVNAPYMGMQQMDDLYSLLNNPNIQNLMLVCSIPILLGGQAFSDFAASVDVTYDVRDNWTIKQHTGEHMKVLRFAEDWKNQNPERNVMLVGGDIHFALYSTLLKDGKVIAEQVVTSPITNKPTCGLAAHLQDIFTGSEIELYNRYKVEHKQKIHKRNYAEISIKNKGWTFRFHTEVEQ